MHISAGPVATAPSVNLRSEKAPGAQETAGPHGPPPRLGSARHPDHAVQPPPRHPRRSGPWAASRVRSPRAGGVGSLPVWPPHWGRPFTGEEAPYSPNIPAHPPRFPGN